MSIYMDFLGLRVQSEKKGTIFREMEIYAMWIPTL